MYMTNIPYENCQVLSPEGQLMFFCSKKKIDWYLNRNLATKVKDEPLTAQLNFIPKDVGNINDPYYLQEMKNQCVICGNKNKLTKHHIVPSCYKRYMPANLISHKSYDVMLVCLSCHAIYEDYAQEYKKTLSLTYLAPIDGIGYTFDKKLGIIKSYANTILKYKDKIPKERVDDLLKAIEQYLNKKVTQEDLVNLLSLKVYNFENYITHGKLVMEKVTDINSFVIEWRKHFITTMQPKFLPQHWTIDRLVVK